MGNLIALVMIVLPLGLDTFAAAATVGANPIPRWNRWRISTIFTMVEGGTPLIGLGLGSSAGHAFGGVAEYLSGGLLILLGSYLWCFAGDHDEPSRARRLVNARGLTFAGLALSIGLDELAIGFSFGLGADLAAPTVPIALIAIQAFILSQLGLSLGARINKALRERVERLVGPVLIVIGLSALAQALIRSEWVLPSGAAIITALVIILSGAIVYRRLAPRTHPVTATRSGSQEGE